MSARATPPNDPSTPSRRLHQDRWPLSAASSMDSISSVLSSQPKLRQAKRTVYEKLDAVLAAMKVFDSLGEFLSVLFYSHPNKSNKVDPRTARHVSVVSAFLQGTSGIHMGHIIDLIYKHRQSQPKQSSQHPNEIYLAFSPAVSPTNIHHARPAMSSWATQLVGEAVHRGVGRLTKNDPDDPDDTTLLRATTNGRSKNVRVAAWKDYASFSMAAIGEKKFVVE
ncbi:hypothetical protein FIBSPDRAFT_967349 [Athelia psychrophila]|uniref:Uncharacterized protein n=1 Tax=Athelia psychrophila TaxID=1759441 RepID=A0A167VTA6_9AGAM|nr:hypothetical protein FIBSPDRAFT_967349 [Fibularhizoctonia sp. CBS 109695]